MLVLTRRIGELVLIGDGIQLKVIDVSNDPVRIGITAPASLRISRPQPETPAPNQSPRRP
jgi:carbon storage regulator